MGKRRRRRMPRWMTEEVGGMPLWGVAAAGAFVLLLGAIALVSMPQQVQADYTRQARPAITTSGTPTPQAQPTSVVILGDSYTSGSDMGGNGPDGWPAILASARGWDVTLDALGGTGYLRSSIYGEPFSARIQSIIDSRPDVLIVAGGINDAGTFPTEQIVDAAAADLTALRAGLPDTRIVVVGPFYPRSAPDSSRDLSARLGETASGLGFAYIDPLPWFEDGFIEIGSDGTHPTDAGHAALAERMDAALTAVGI